jgi:hypothetical protein
MPPTAAIIGADSTFSVGDGLSAEGFTVIGEITSLSGPEISAEEIEVTNLDSALNFKEFISGLKDGGSVTFTMNWNKSANQVAVRDDVAAGTKRNYEMTWATSPETKFAFQGLPISFSMSADPASAVTADLSIRIDGAGVWT